MAAPESVWDVVEIKDYPEETKPIAGKEEKLGELSADDVEIFVRELDLFIQKEQHPILRRAIIMNANYILDIIRSVQYETKAGFKGAFARGNELALTLLSPNLLGWGSTTYSWLKTYSSTGAQNWIGSSSSTISLGDREGHIYLALFDPIDVPKVDAVQLTKDGDSFVIEMLSHSFRITNDIFPTHILREPWLIAPRHNYYVQVRVAVTGDDKLQPLGFTIKEARNLMSL